MRITRACICGSDLWPYKTMEHDDGGRRMGHEFIGVVEDVGAEVARSKVGDVVVAPFAYSDGTCEFCREGLRRRAFTAASGAATASTAARARRSACPQADGTLVALPVAEDDALMPSLLTLSDVFGTGHHAARAAGVGPGKTVAVIGDGAVGLCGVIAARRLGAEQIILLGRHADRIALAREFGATDVVSERGEEAVERVRELTGGYGAHSVLECVGLEQSTLTALRIARPGGAVGRVGAPAGRSRFPRRCRPSSATSPSAAASRRRARTSRSCCPTCSTADRARSRVRPHGRASTRCPTATARWTSAKRSRS